MSDLMFYKGPWTLWRNPESDEIATVVSVAHKEGPRTLTPSEVQEAMSLVEDFCRRLGLTYDDPRIVVWENVMLPE